jgi:hypothetical protein
MVYFLVIFKAFQAGPVLVANEFDNGTLFYTVLLFLVKRKPPAV